MGCTATVEQIIVPVREPVFPPEAYIKECYPVRPGIPTIENVIVSQQEAILQCNAQLSAIRVWKDVQTEIIKEENNRNIVNENQ